MVAQVATAPKESPDGVKTRTESGEELQRLLRNPFTRVSACRAVTLCHDSCTHRSVRARARVGVGTQG